MLPCSAPIDPNKVGCGPSDVRIASNITATPAGTLAEPGGWDVKSTGISRLRCRLVPYGTVTGTAYAIYIESPATTAIKKTNRDGTSATLIAAATELFRWTKSGGTAKTFTDTDVTPATNQIAIAAHGYTTGWAMTYTSTGTPPTPLVDSTVYYVIVVSAGVIKLATSYENAANGVAINLTDAGTVAATNTLTPAAIVQGDTPPVLEYAVDLDLAEHDWVGVVDTQNNFLCKIDAGTSIVMRTVTWLERTA